MALGEELVKAGYIRAEDVDRALEYQRASGQPLGECLLAIGAITSDGLDGFFNYSVPPVSKIEDTGLNRFFVLDLMLKIMFSYGHETKRAVANEIKLPLGIVDKLMDLAYERRLVESMGATDQSRLSSELRYGLSEQGRNAAVRALELSNYAGPAPVTLEQFSAQVERQRIINDRVDTVRLKRSLSRLTLPAGLVERLGPAVNSGRSLLLYGEPGNGKTSIAVAVADSFEQYIYVPYALSVGSQVINIYDPSLHQPITELRGKSKPEPEPAPGLVVQAEDPRWMRCHRPIAITGGELTMKMLDINYNEQLRYSEAPLHLKAVSGVLLIDDLGRQEARVEDILNRWVFPLERGTDFLTLHTGKKFAVPFGGLIIFSTNKPPSQLVDEALLRRIPYKYYIGPPTLDEYIKIFREVCEDDLEYSQESVDDLIRSFYPKYNLQLARFHPGFMIRHIMASYRYEGQSAQLTRDVLFDAAEHLIVKD